MIRVAIVAAVVAGALTTAGGPGVADADPGDPVLCNFTMSDPKCGAIRPMATV